MQSVSAGIEGRKAAHEMNLDLVGYIENLHVARIP
jgi:hypothetical protein